MSFPARAFRVLIASPSDVLEERDIAVRTIQEWNDLNAPERQIVLLPLRWETHSAPTYGQRPQAVINNQVVDHCDLLVGVFWTRVGSPTGVADSGTIEEIERVAAAGKPVMLYFSQAKQDPEAIDIEQLSKLREFKKKTFPNALVEQYAGPVDFKDKLSRQLEIQLRTLLAGSHDGPNQQQIAPLVTDIVFTFASVDEGASLGHEIDINTQHVQVEDFEAIPDFLGTESDSDSPTPKGLRTQSSNALSRTLPNRGYYRQTLTYRVLQGFFRPIRFWLKNRGAIGARDVHLDISVRGTDASLVVIGKGDLPTSEPSRFGPGYGLLGTRHPDDPSELIDRAGRGWTVQMDVPALQPQREISPEPTILIGATTSCTVTVAARIYADTLSEPVLRELVIRLNVDQVAASAKDLLADELPSKAA